MSSSGSHEFAWSSDRRMRNLSTRVFLVSITSHTGPLEETQLSLLVIKLISISSFGFYGIGHSQATSEK